ncbi:hypothetical protein [Rothia sp. ZJ932]|uniref:hypothetical protein n=1 Tax=Rothia sp. ZJ932 TaxID=2810516 RepID=UPI00196705C4|nr:hypothetical protein [Rothia sp. ZJ932]QRZ61080.1 hypothetical protein JR346_07410 [Rothia sp. ZJ932]
MNNTPRSPHCQGLYDAACSRYQPQPADSPVDTPKFASLLDALVSVAAGVCNIEQDALEHLEILSAGMRSVVVRCVFAFGADSSPQGSRHTFSVIAKHYRRKDSATNSGGFGYIREVCSLPTFNYWAPKLFSSLLGSDPLKRVTVTEDLGNFRSVHALLTKGEIEAGLDAYLKFFEDIYAQDDTWHIEFQAAVKELDPQATSPGSLTSPRLGIKGWRRLAAIAGVPLAESVECTLEINTVPAFSMHTVLSHGDFSPHNIAVADAEVRAFDAEGAAIHHAFLPVADMLLGFPLSPYHRDYLPLVERALWQDACRRLYALAAQHDLEAGFDTDLHLSEQMMVMAGMVLELTGFTAHDLTDTHRQLLTHTAARVAQHYPDASALIQRVLEHRNL